MHQPKEAAMPVRVEAVCVSVPETRVAKKPLAEVYVGPLGLEGDRHAGELYTYQKTGQQFPNKRQWSAVSTEEVEAFCRELGVAPFGLGELGENIRISGMSLGDIQPGTIFEFPSGCRLQVHKQNDPCENAAAELGGKYGEAIERGFVKASFGHRGVVGVVLIPGLIRTGDEITVIVPEGAPAAV
jgi:MOSC domain-containing protein YiiM